MTHDSQYRGPAVRAIEYAVSVQDTKLAAGGIIPGQDSDTSVTGWFVMALQKARMAGLKVPKETLDRVTSYLDLRSSTAGDDMAIGKKSSPPMPFALKGCCAVNIWAGGKMTNGWSKASRR